MVELVRAGRSPEALSRAFEPTAQSIHNWEAQADRDEGRRSDGFTAEERKELVRVRRENRQLRIEREVLSKGIRTTIRGKAARVMPDLVKQAPWRPHRTDGGWPISPTFPRGRVSSPWP